MGTIFLIINVRIVDYLAIPAIVGELFGGIVFGANFCSRLDLNDLQEFSRFFDLILIEVDPSSTLIPKFFQKAPEF